MTEKQTYWLVDATGDHALITGADERDRWVPLGWTPADEPIGDAFVWAWLDGITVPARFPAAALAEVFGPKGWVAGPPPQAVSPFNGDQAVPAAAPTTSTAAAPAAPAKSTVAAGDATKEK
jgi:hypothetical protein